MKHFDAAENGALVDFYSPIPPIRSGTADYFDEVLRRVLRVPGVARYLRIVVSSDDLNSDVPDAYQGVEVIDERRVSQNGGRDHGYHPLVSQRTHPKASQSLQGRCGGLYRCGSGGFA